MSSSQSANSPSPRRPCIVAQWSPCHCASNCQNCARSKQPAHPHLHYLYAASAPTRYPTCPSSLLPCRSSCSGRLSTSHAVAHCKSPICYRQSGPAACAHRAHVACVVLHYALLLSLLWIGTAPLGFETKCCVLAKWCSIAQNRDKGTSGNPKEKIVTNTPINQIYPLHCSSGPI